MAKQSTVKKKDDTESKATRPEGSEAKARAVTRSSGAKAVPAKKVEEKKAPAKKAVAKKAAAKKVAAKKSANLQSTGSAPPNSKPDARDTLLDTPLDNLDAHPRTESRGIRVGIGGWTFEPWRGEFYPKGLPHKRELEYASRQINTIEINGTFYRLQTPATFAKWRDETPDGFVFALKATRYSTNRRVLADAKDSIERFLGSGPLELKDKLGPINWQLAPTKQFEPDDVEGFLSLLPKEADGIALRHAIEARHPSFQDERFVALARKYEVATVIAADSKFPQIADPTARFIYARIMGTEDAHRNGYTDAALDAWLKRLRTWAKGDTPADLETFGKPARDVKAREVFLYVISGAKVRNPAAAMTLLDRLVEGR